MSRALLVVDVQGEYDGGALPIAWPPLEVSLPNVRRAIDAARARGIPLVVVQQTGPADAPAFAPGSPHRGYRVEVLSDATGLLPSAAAALEGSGMS